ncbi:hydrogenase iron-sulfur subunit, partial [Candidatus Deferrimicrobium sp.]|uniref:hydrogenase iron-sulfur subunit n=1 Tax=Candidatus Deferrimicrobium sp. TaxID=3060586 RepID=UPI002EDB43B9
TRQVTQGAHIREVYLGCLDKALSHITEIRPENEDLAGALQHGDPRLAGNFPDYRKNNTSLSIRNRHNQCLPLRYMGPVILNELHTDPKGDPQVLNQASALMSETLSPDVVVYLCTNCIPQGVDLPRQWNQDGSRILVREVPCSGKMDGQYLLHAMEGGARGFCVVACPKGDCHLSQGNYRAEIRVRTVRRLLEEIGLPPERARLVHFSQVDPPRRLEQLVRSTVEQIVAMGENPLHGAK